LDLEKFARRWEESIAQQGTSLSRIIDPRVQNNVLALGIAIVAGVAALAARLLDDTGTVESLLDAFGAGVAVFLAWALGRELDPDNDSSALVAELGAFALWFWLPSSAGLLFATLILVRLIVRSTGRAPTRGDLIFAALVTAGTVAVAVSSYEGWSRPKAIEWLLLGAGVFSAPLLGVQTVDARGDFTGKPLDVRRVQAARVATVLVALVGFGVAGGLGISRLAGLWAALVSVALTKIARAVRT
jgi:hypothetical protein